MEREELWGCGTKRRGGRDCGGLNGDGGRKKDARDRGEKEKEKKRGEGRDRRKIERREGSG